MVNLSTTGMSRLKVMGGGWVALVILVSALGTNPSFFLFWTLFFNLLGQGLGLGPGLDNYCYLPLRLSLVYNITILLSE